MKALLKKLLLFCKQVLRLLPLLCMAGLLLWMLRDRREFSVELLLSYVPEDRLLSVLVLWLLFAVKSVTVMLPVMLLFAASGVLFPLPVALLVNTVGIAVTLTIPYFIGRFSGPDLTWRLMKRHPRLSELRALRSENSFFFAFIVRAMGVLPCDMVSLYMGNTRLPYAQYLSGGVLGFLPDLICASVLGMHLSNMNSPWFWLTAAVNVACCVTSALIYRGWRRKKLAGGEARPGPAERGKSSLGG